MFDIWGCLCLRRCCHLVIRLMVRKNVEGQLSNTTQENPFFIVKCLRPKAHNAIFSHLDLQLTNQLEPVEGSTYKTRVKGLKE